VTTVFVERRFAKGEPPQQLQTAARRPQSDREGRADHTLSIYEAVFVVAVFVFFVANSAASARVF
jgi:hypothetical protein